MRNSVGKSRDEVDSRAVSIAFKLWRGDYGLIVTFWLWGVGGEAAIGVLSVVINVVATPGPSALAVVGPSLLLFGAVVFLYRFVVTVGIVNAAIADKGRVAVRVSAILFVFALWLSRMLPIPLA